MLTLDTLLDRAISLHQAGQLNEAESLYREVLGHAPHQPDALHLLGLVALAKDIPAEAVSLIYRAIEKHPDTPANFYASLGHALQAWEKPYEALEQYQLSLDKEPGQPDILNNMGNIWRTLNKPEKAEDCYRAAVAADPSNPLPHSNIGLLLKDRGDTAAALQAFETAIRGAPEDPQAYYHKANLLRETGQADTALSFHEEAIRRDRRNHAYHLSKGRSLEQLKDYELALDCYERALSCAPDDIESFTHKAALLLKMDRIADASAMVADDLTHENMSAQTYAVIGLIHQKKGDYYRALDHYQKAIRLDPSIPGLCNNLALMVMECGDDPDEALGLLFKALTDTPEQEDIQHNIAVLLQRLYADGRIERAAQIAQNWHKQYPDQAIAAHTAAALNKETKSRADADYVAATFDAFAENYNSQMGKIAYRGAEICEEALKDVYGAPEGSLAILDAGCGTGLCAPALAPYAQELTGVDLSPLCLEQARETDLYSQLETSDLISYLTKKENAFDLIAAMDVCCYFGDLAPLLKAADKALNKNGTLIFSVEKNPDEASTEPHLQPNGRFTHTKNHIEAAAHEAGFLATTIKEAPLRNEYEAQVKGLVVIMSK